MKTISTLLAAVGMIVGLLILPSAAEAKNASITDFVCDTSYTNITPGDETGDDDGYQVFWFYTNIGDNCSMEVSFDENPLMVFVTGGQMTMDSNWTLNEEAQTGTVDFTATELQQVDSQVEVNLEEGQTLTQVAFLWQTESVEGPDEKIQGAWVSSDFQEYTLIPAGDTGTRMGAQIEGDAGDAGQFSIYLPSTAVASLVGNHDEYQVESFDIEENMAAYLANTEQKDATITQTEDGGAFVTFTAEISAGVAESQSQSMSIAGAGGLAVRATTGPRDSVEKPNKLKKNKLKVKKMGKKYATLNWADVEGAETYTLHLRKCKNHSGAKCTKQADFVKAKNYKKFKNLTISQKKVKQLKPGSYYQWRVRSCNDAGCSAFSAWSRFETNGTWSS